MPTRPPKACSRCGRPTLNRGRCGDCTRQRYQREDAKRGTASERGYDTKWATAKRGWLASHPVCVRCGRPGADAVDHEPAVDRSAPDWRKQLWDRKRWRSMHRACHSVKTAAQDIARDAGGRWTGPQGGMG